MSMMEEIDGNTLCKKQAVFEILRKSTTYKKAAESHEYGRIKETQNKHKGTVMLQFKKSFYIKEKFFYPQG